ncbi:MAG: EAL domain-containing protein [Burkholderiales bacterium]
MSPHSPSRPHQCILVADDEELTRLFARQALEAEGFHVEEAEDGKSALEVARRVRPDLIILDVLMPGKSGFEVCQEMRRRPEFRRTPILMMTGLDDADSVKHAYDCGATDFVTKPVSWALLCYRVRYLLRASDAIAQLAKSHVLLANAQKLAGLSSFDWNHANDRLSVNGELFAGCAGRAGDGTLPLSAFWELFAETGRAEVIKEVTASVGIYLPLQTDCQVRAAQDGVRHVHLQCETVVGMDGRPLWTHGTLQDITQRKRSEEEAKRLAFYDGLTGLPNRMFFREVLAKTLLRAQRDGTLMAVLFLDVDNFKRINDSLGHDMGDQLLKEFSARLGQCVREDSIFSRQAMIDGSDMVARLGGDEFILLLSHIKERYEAGKVAERILKACSQPIAIADREVFASASIGIAVYPEDGADAETLLKNADSAMYIAKGKGRGRYQYYNAAMNEFALLKLELDSAMRKGLERGEFFLNYQPRVDARTEKITGCEALIRWRHPQRGIVPPGMFIGIAEESGFIMAFDAWVINEACRQLREWEKQGIPLVPISVNLSAAQFSHGNLVSSISEALARHEVDPRYLHVEITEGVLMRDTELALKALKGLSDLGLKVEIDDFGTGFSSLSYLNRFPVDVLKIDLSFVRDVHINRDNAAITRAIISLAKSLNLSVIAEGVETQGERKYLEELGCYDMQGYFFGRPCDPAEFAKRLLEANRASQLEPAAEGLPS